jgi:hypothetical protein
MTLISEEAPAQFLWTHDGIWGLAKNVDYQPRPDRYLYANEIHVASRLLPVSLMCIVNSQHTSDYE